MKSSALVLIAGSSLLVGVHAGDNIAFKNEIASLQGKWSIIRVEGGGVDRTEEFKGVTLLFSNDGKKFELSKDGETKKVTFATTINLSKKPKEITITDPNTEKPMLGIYKLEKNTLTLCYGRNTRAERPTDFVLDKDGRHLLMILERAK